MSPQCLSLLVVEDERSLSKLWAMELGDLIEPTLAYSLAEARAKLKARAFDVILLDLHLPDGNGLDLLAEVVEHGDPSAVIVLTGHADLDSAIQALRLGAYDFLLKPCKIGELEQRLLRIAREQALTNQNLALRQQLHIQRIDSLELIWQKPRSCRDSQAYRPCRTIGNFRLDRRGDRHRQGGGGQAGACQQQP